MPSPFAPYLPAFQLRRLTERASQPRAATEERGEGATLLVDVAGFTSLTDRFATRGPAGAEQLSEILNTYFGRMTDIIAQHGGDVALFAGDAVLAVWPADTRSLTDMTRLAAQCALALARELHGFKPAEDVELRHRTAVGAGPLSYFNVGGESGRWQPLLAGDAIAQLGPTRKLARPGEVLVAPEAWLHIARFARAELLEDGEARLDEMTETLALPGPPALETSAATDDLIRAYVPDVVLQRIEAGHDEWLAEFRPVVVVFIHIAGVEYGTAGTLDRLQKVLLSVQRPLEHYEGAVYQFVMDDKGTSLVAAFGLPHLAQEHEAVRALSAAEAIHGALSGMAVRASIGIASGRAFCGAYGNARRRQYTIVGPVINLASRLTGPAAGGILCDELTQKRAQDRIRFETLAPVMIKGRSDPIPVFRPAGRVDTAAVQEASVFVGRDAERELLHKRIDALLAGSGGVVSITGEAGIGKSFLLRDVVSYARAHNARVLVGAGDATERSTTFYAWRELLARLLVPQMGASVSDMRASLLQQLSDDQTLLSWAPLLNAILPLGLEDNDVTRYMESEARIDSIQAIVARLTENATDRQPTVLIIDDLHWVDSTSLLLVLGVALRVPELLIVCATRPLEESSPAAMHRLQRWPGGQHITLEPLSTRDIMALVRQRLGVIDIPDALATFIQERAEGHPFYTDELALALCEAGLVVVEAGHARVVAEDLNAANFPDSVQAVVNSRIDRLQPVEQLALKTASVIGRVFPFDVLAAVYPIEHDRPQLRSALQAFERADLAHLETPDPHLSYLFRHVITQDVAYNSLLFAHRRQLHEGIARWYEEHYEGSLSALYPLLAHHYDRAEVTEKAVEYLEKAGVEALRAFSSQECAQFFTRVQQIAEQHPELADVHRRAEWERYLGDAHQHMTDYSRSQVHFYEALRLIGRRTPKSRVGIIAALMKESVRQFFHRIAPGRFVGSARGARHRDLTNAAVAYRGLTEIMFFQGDTLGMIYTSLCCLNCGERARHYNSMSTGAGGCAVIFSVLGLGALRSFYIRMGVNYAKEGLNLTDIAYVDGIQTTLVEIAALRWEEAEAAALRGLAGFARVGYRIRWEALYSGYGFMLQLIGRFDEAMHAFNEVYASARGQRPQNMIFARNGQLGTGLVRGEFAPEWVDELADLMSRSAPMTEATTGYGLIAQAKFRAGDHAGAWAALERGLELVTKHPPDTYYGLTGFANIAATYLEMWEFGVAPVSKEETGRRAKQACALLRSYSRFLRMGRPRAALCTAWYEALRGREQQAVKILYRGLATARKIRMPYDEALTHYMLARWLPESDPRRAEHLLEAISGLERLGALHHLARARSLAKTPVIPHTPVLVNR